ncbi:hypothetical protein LH128_15411 [Sphingomonas sp. LH128]|nr:hypothetical protein LH128_15411 [Sphingomonas sp. LH128]
METIMTIIRADAASAWRDRARYDRLLGYDRATWAWEWLRRSLGREPVMLRRTSWTMRRAMPPLYVLSVKRRRFGPLLPLAVLDDVAGFAGHVFWCGDQHAPVLAVDAVPAPHGTGDGFHLHALRHPAVVLRHRGGEHLLIAEGPRCIRIAVRSGTLLAGPVRLVYHVPDGIDVEAKLLTLRRLTALCRLGRFPATLFPPERRARRWALALQAWDGRQAGASHRDIAAVIHGERLVRRDWLGASDYLRTHVKRLLRTADMLVGGGWKHLLR